MTFLPELKRLMDARALGGFSGVDAENELQGYLLNHAPALAELVEAAEKTGADLVISPYTMVIPAGASKDKLR